MPDWKNIVRARLRDLRIDPARESEIVDEMAQHLEDRYRERVTNGDTEEEACRRVTDELEDCDAMIAQLRGVEAAEPSGAATAATSARGSFWAGLPGDVRFAGRTLRKAPAFTLFVVLTLALGIGATTAVFTLINTLLLNPLPVHDPSRLVAVETKQSDRPHMPLRPVSWLNLQDYERSNEVFSSISGYTGPVPLTLSRGSAAERVFGQFVSANYFDTLGLHPVLGRFFSAEENGASGVHPVAVLGYTAWRYRFGGAPDIVGRAIRLNNNAEVTVIGVAPEGFKGVTVMFGPDLWLPAGTMQQLFPAQAKSFDDRSDLQFEVAARLKPGVARSQAQANLDTIDAALKKQFPDTNQKQTLAVRPLAEAAQGDGRQSLMFGSAVLLLVVALVLLIACSNAASLFLARSASRRQEVAVRLALGASRARLLRQLLVESAVLGIASGVVGVVVAYEACRFLWSFRPPEVALNFVDPKMDAGVLLFALALSLLTGIVFGLVPALQASRSDVVTAIREEARTVGRSHRRVSFRNILLAGQVALSLVCLITATLFLRSIQRAYTIDPGFQTSRLAVFLMNQGQLGYDRPRTETFYRSVRTRLASLPGVTAVSWASNLPLWNSAARQILRADQGQIRKENALPVLANTVDLEYFRTLGVPVLGGRTFTEADRDGSVPVTVINEAAAAKYWPGERALGRRFHFVGDAVERQIVGIVGTANYTSLGEPPQPCVFLPLRQNFAAGMVLYVRTQAAPGPMLPVVQRELRSIDAQLDVSDARTGGKIIDQALFAAKMGVGLLSVFGLLGLALASVGLYGNIAYTVNQRRREIGVRVALGADRAAVMRMVIRQGMTVVGSGIALGLVAALLLGRALSRLLYGISAADPVSLAGASLVLIGVALTACYLPALRAARVDPAEALRET